MGAGFFSVEPRPTRALPGGQQIGMGSRVRQVHRWVSIAFILSVAANFTAMIWGEPPTWITYSPLLQLLMLLATGLYMLGRHYIRPWRVPAPVE